MSKRPPHADLDKAANLVEQAGSGGDLGHWRRSRREFEKQPQENFLDERYIFFQLAKLNKERSTKHQPKFALSRRDFVTFGSDQQT